MADLTKTVKYLIVGDASGLSKTLSGASKDLQGVAKSGGLKGLGRDLANAVRSGQGLKGVGGILKNSVKEAGGLGVVAGKAALGLAAVGAASAAAGAAIAIKFGADSVDVFKKVGGEVFKVKRLTGMTTEEASRLNFAFKQTGVDSGTGAKGVQMLGKNLGNAADGGKKAAAMAKTLGFEFTDANGKVKPMSELMPKLADKFANMPDGANKTALAMKLFGKSGTDMLPFLNKGAAGLEELAAKSDKFGNTLNDKQLQALKDSKQAQRDWDAAMQGLQVTLGANLLPLLTESANMINSVAVPAFQGMAEWITKNQGTFDALGNMMRWVWNNILLPLVKFAITGFVEMNKPLAQGVILLGQLSGNKDMENFGRGVLDAANDVESFVAGLHGIPDQVTPQLKVKDEASAHVKEIDSQIKGLKGKIVEAKAKGDASEVKKLQEKIDDLKGKKVTIAAAVRLVDHEIQFKVTNHGTVKVGVLAGGGIVSRYAGGGMEDHSARIYRTHDGLRIFNERETRGESYIPLANDWRRPRALAIWRQTGRELGVYAGGGIRGGYGAGGGVQDVHLHVTLPVGADIDQAAKQLVGSMRKELISLNGRVFGGRGLGFA